MKDLQANHYGSVSEQKPLCGAGDSHQPTMEKEAEGQARRKKPAVRLPFRYAVGAILLLANTMQYYANNTLYIASFEMVASDVLNRGLTQLRAKHLADDPLAAGANAASPGTCPLHPATPTDWSFLDQVNATLQSARARTALANDELELEQQVADRLARGELVDWSLGERANVFLAHTLGGRLFAVPFSWVGISLGKRPVALVSCLGITLTSALLPLVVGSSPSWVVLLLNLISGGFVFGLTSVSYPLIGVWFPVDEAGALLGYFLFASTLGVALCNLISTQLFSMQLEWHWSFYLSATLMAFCTLLVCAFIEDSPEQSKFVSADELEELEESAANVSARRQEQVSLLEGARCNCDTRAKIRTCPARRVHRDPVWSRLIACPVVWSCVACQFAFWWFDKMTVLWPTYLANVAHMSPAIIGYITASEGLVSVVYGYLFAYFTRKLPVDRPFNIGLTAYRRCNQVLAILTAAVIVGLLTIFDCGVWSAVLAMILQPVSVGFSIVANRQILLDISADDSGLLAGYIHTLSVGDVVSIPVSSALLSGASEPGSPPAGTRTGWRHVWLLSLALKVVAGVAFLLFGSASPKSYSRARPSGGCSSLGARESQQTRPTTTRSYV